jgi:hypothetical protein
VIRRFLRFAMLVLSLLLLLGCATTRDRAVVAVNGMAAFSKGAREALEDRTILAAERCLQAADRAAALDCGSKEQRSLAPAWAGYRALHSAWLALAAVIQAADLAQTDPSAVDLLKLLAKLNLALADFQKLAAVGDP